MKPIFPLILKSTIGHILIHADSIVRVVAEDKYARLTYTNGRTELLFHSLSDIERRLACGTRVGELLFVRTHRSCIAAMHHATGLEGRERVLLQGQSAPISRENWPMLLRLLGTVRGAKSTVRSA